MKAPPTPNTANITTTRKLLSAHLIEEVAKINRNLETEILPSKEQAATVERLAKILLALPPQDIHKTRRIDLLLLIIAVPILLALSFLRLPSAAVDLEVRATGVTLIMGGNHSDLLLPGETGQVLALSEARISGASEVSPAALGHDSTIELRTLALDKELPDIRKVDLAIRLQDIVIPSDDPFKLRVGLAYAANSRGVLLNASGQKPATAQFDEVIPINNSEHEAKTRYVLRPVTISGTDLEMQLFPFHSEGLLTVLRDVHVSEITFDDGGHSSILGGSILIKGRSDSKTIIQPSDNIVIRSAAPMLVREIIFEKDKLKVTLATVNANTILIGDDSPRDLRPTLFEWVRFRWPTQLYGTLSALVALWFAARSWWKSA